MQGKWACRRVRSIDWLLKRMCFLLSDFKSMTKIEIFLFEFAYLDSLIIDLLQSVSWDTKKIWQKKKKKKFFVSKFSTKICSRRFHLQEECINQRHKRPTIFSPATAASPANRLHRPLPLPTLPRLLLPLNFSTLQQPLTNLPTFSRNR